MSFLQGLMGTSNGAPSGSMNPQQHAQAQQFMNQYGQNGNIATQQQNMQSQQEANALLGGGQLATAQGQANMGQMGSYMGPYQGMTAPQGASQQFQGVTTPQGATAAFNGFTTPQGAASQGVGNGNLTSLLANLGQGAASTANVGKATTGQFANGFTPYQPTTTQNVVTTGPTTANPGITAPARTPANTRTTQPIARRTEPGTTTTTVPAVTPGQVNTPAGKANIVNPVTGAIPGQKANIQGNYQTDPTNSAYQYAYDPGKGYSFSDPTKGESSYNVNNTGWSPTLQAAQNTFTKAFGTPNGAIGNISPAVLAALTGSAPPAAAKPAAPVAAKPAAPVATNPNINRIATPLRGGTNGRLVQ